MVYSKEFLQLKVPAELKILLYSILLLVISLFALLFWGRLDDVIKVKGFVRTKENVSLVKNVISGKIIRINYKPGQKVKKGDFLYELDSSIYDSQRKSLQAETENLERRIKGLDSLLLSYSKDKNLIAQEDKVSFSRYESYRKNIEKLLLQKEISFQALQDEKNLPASMKNEKNIIQKKMEYEFNKKNLESFRADFEKNLRLEKEDSELSYSKCLQEMKKLNKQYEFLKINASLDGFIQETSSLNIGDYLESGQGVLNIIPNDEKNFRVEMQISPKDMGKIKTGLKVKYRLSAFPFFEYKGAEGIITAVDPDIRSSQNGFLYFVVYADLDRTIFKNRHGELFPVKAGLETDCRIVLENETIISYILKKIDFIY